MSALLRPNPENKQYRTHRIRRLTLLSILASTILLLTLGITGRVNPAQSLAQPILNTSTSTKSALPTRQASPTVTATIPLPSPTPSATLSENPVLNPSDQIDSSESFYSGTIYLSLQEATGKHLFAYNPHRLPFTRITNGAWDDMSPAASPDGTYLAFASNRGGYWDLYVLNLKTGNTIQITNTPQFDSNPSWSPDSQWIVYESYTTPYIDDAQQTGDISVALDSDASIQSNFDLFILQLDESKSQQGDPIRLSNTTAAEITPSWSPGGRHIAFASNKTGEYEIWLADLDQIENRFRNISQNPSSNDRFPTWSPDGESLAWSSTSAGYQNIVFKPVASGHQQVQVLGAGERPYWSPDNQAVITFISSPNHTYLSGYLAHSPGLALPPVTLPGLPSGLTWSPELIDYPLAAPLAQAAEESRNLLTQDHQNADDKSKGTRQRIVELVDVETTYPMLNDLVDEAFYELRTACALRLGWDYLSTLESAFVPLTSPLFPGMLNDWLYTGRAITLNTAPINAGWMVVTREDIGSDVFWRIFLRTRFQDGSQGMPLYEFPWDFNSRSSGDPLAYEQGGSRLRTIPPGYWVDFTQLAISKGWERLPALITWRSAIPAARYNEFIHREGLDWLSAMSQIYPLEAINTPTPVIPPTHSPTPSPWPTRTPIPTRTPWPTRTPSPTP